MPILGNILIVIIFLIIIYIFLFLELEGYLICIIYNCYINKFDYTIKKECLLYKESQLHII